MKVLFEVITYINQSGQIGEKLRCDREEKNDKFAVKLVRNDGNKEQCVEDTCPSNTAKYLNFFLKEVAKYLQL